MAQLESAIERGMMGRMAVHTPPAEFSSSQFDERIGHSGGSASPTMLFRLYVR